MQRLCSIGRFRPTFLALVTTLLASVAGSAEAADTLNLSEYDGQVVVIDFWASWCVPCRRSFPWMNAMQEKYKDDGLVIIGVNMDAEADEAATFLQDYPADFTIVYDQDGDLARQYDVIAMPSSYIVGRDGQQVARHLGFKVKKQDEYEAIIVEALKQ